MSERWRRNLRSLPRAAVGAWLAGLLALPALLLWGDRYLFVVHDTAAAVPGLRTLMVAVQSFGKYEWQMPLVIVAYFIARRKGWREAKRWLWVTLAAVHISGAVGYGLKIAVRRERPGAVAQHAGATRGWEGIATGKALSFPSGDTCSAFALACVLAAFVPRLRLAALVLAALVGLSRLYFLAHYFSDVDAGALVGSLTAGILVVHYPPRPPAAAG